MGTRRLNSQQKVGSSARSAKDVRLENRARAIRMRLRANLVMLRGTASFPKGAAELAQRLVIIGARQRLKLATWDDLEQVERDVLLGMTGAALLTALAYGMSRPEFAAWLRRSAANIERDERAAFGARVRQAMRQ